GKRRCWVASAVCEGGDGGCWISALVFLFLSCFTKLSLEGAHRHCRLLEGRLIVTTAERAGRGRAAPWIVGGLVGGGPRAAAESATAAAPAGLVHLRGRIAQ